VSESRHQAVIDAPLEAVWEYVGHPKRYPEWWPRVMEVRGSRFEEGTEFVQVSRTPLGRAETTFLIDRMDELREVRMHCTKSGTFAHWQLTGAQGGTFVEVTFGMEPLGTGYRVLDATLARPFFRRWLIDSVEALGRALRVRQT
jgi:uncharacterized protein YndB with AHSA1/START domain